MVLIPLLSNHFLRRSMFRLTRIGRCAGIRGRCVLGASLGTPHPDPSLGTTSICRVPRLVFTWCMSRFSSTCNPNQKYRCSKLAP
jgi:hypothetical protein